MDYLKPFQSNYLYNITVAPTTLAVSLEEVKEFLKLDPADASPNVLLTMLINAAAECFEKITSRTLMDTTFETFRNFLTPAIELRRSPFLGIVNFTYTVDSLPVVIDSTLFSPFIKNDYSYITLKNGKSYPTNGDDILQGIRIEFRAGLGPPLSPLHDDIKVALLNHINMLYENRGDCDNAGCAACLPNTSRCIYNKYIIPEIV